MAENAAPEVPTNEGTQNASIVGRRPPEWGPRSRPRGDDVEDLGRHLDRLFELHGAPDNN